MNSGLAADLAGVLLGGKSAFRGGCHRADETLSAMRATETRARFPIVASSHDRLVRAKKRIAVGFASAVWFLASPALGCDFPATISDATPEEIRAFFKDKEMDVLTFLGYSGAEYEDKAAMLDGSARILDRFDPKKTIVNIGATPEGIGAVYETAKRKGFITTGIVSTQARDNKVALSPCVDALFYVNDATWGGFLPGTERLSPTSQAMVENSDVVVAIGGGEVARDELIAAKRSGKQVQFIPADMNHQIAREKALKKSQPMPTDFRGAAATAFQAESLPRSR